MAKIFLAFHGINDEGKLPVFYDALISNLQAVGHELLLCPHQVFGGIEWGGLEQIPASTKQDIQNFNPDICIIFNNYFYDLSELVKCPIIIWSVDSALYFGNASFIRKNPARYHFIVSRDDIEILRKYFGVNENQMRLGVPFSAVKAENLPVTENIVFIASKFTTRSTTTINDFLNENPGDAERAEFKNALEHFKKNPYLQLQDLVEARIITYQRVLNYFNINRFLMELSDEKRIQVLAAVADLGLKLYGSKRWAEDYFYQSGLNLCYTSEKVMTLLENQRVYNSAKIGISAAHLQAVSGFPWRILDIMQSNACLVSDYHGDFDRLFPKNLFPVYKDQYEAREICKELLANEKKRKKIVRRCQAYAAENFPFRRVLDNVNELLGNKIL